MTTTTVMMTKSKKKERRKERCCLTITIGKHKESAHQEKTIIRAYNGDGTMWSDERGQLRTKGQEGGGNGKRIRRTSKEQMNVRCQRIYIDIPCMRA